MSNFSILVPTKATVKLVNRNTGHDKVIGIILCRFTNCIIIYPVGLVYYFSGHPSNTISLGALKVFVGFQKVTSEPIENFDFFDPLGQYWISTYQNKKIRLSSNMNCQS